MMSATLLFVSGTVSIVFILIVLNQFSTENHDYLRWFLEKL